MNYFLFKLQFDTAVHFGGADSALSLYTSEETLRQIPCFLPSAMRPSSSTEKKP